MNSLKKQYDDKLAQKEELQKQAELTELKLDRAGKLVTGLAGERVRWEETAKVGSSTLSAMVFDVYHHLHSNWRRVSAICQETV